MAAIGGPAWHGASDRRVTPWNERTTAARLGWMAYRAAFDRGAGAEAFAAFNRRANAAAARANGFDK